MKTKKSLLGVFLDREMSSIYPRRFYIVSVNGAQPFLAASPRQHGSNSQSPASNHQLQKAFLS